MRALLQTITDREAATEKRLNEMNIQLEKVHKDNADLRREQTDNLADVLEKICRHFYYGLSCCWSLQ